MWGEREASGLISPAAWVLSGGGLAFLPRPQRPCLLLQGAFWGLMAGLAVGATRLVLEFLHPAPPCGHPDTRPPILHGVHYLHFAVTLFLLSGAVVVAGSLLTPHPQDVQVSPPSPLASDHL